MCHVQSARLAEPESPESDIYLSKFEPTPNERLSLLRASLNAERTARRGAGGAAAGGARTTRGSDSDASVVRRVERRGRARRPDPTRPAVPRATPTGREPSAAPSRQRAADGEGRHRAPSPRRDRDPTREPTGDGTRRPGKNPRPPGGRCPATPPLPPALAARHMTPRAARPRTAPSDHQGSASAGRSAPIRRRATHTTLDLFLSQARAASSPTVILSPRRRAEPRHYFRRDRMDPRRERPLPAPSPTASPPVPVAAVRLPSVAPRTWALLSSSALPLSAALSIRATSACEEAESALWLRARDRMVWPSSMRSGSARARRSRRTIGSSPCNMARVKTWNCGREIEQRECAECPKVQKGSSERVAEEGPAYGLAEDRGGE